jgi:hypothetical protein
MLTCIVCGVLAKLITRHCHMDGNGWFNFNGAVPYEVWQATTNYLRSMGLIERHPENPWFKWLPVALPAAEQEGGERGA